MLRLLLHAVAIPAYTLVFGTLAIVFSLLRPGGDALHLFAKPWARCIAWTCRTRIRVEGRQRLPAAGPCVYMCNHQSHFDVVALIIALPGGYRILAKRGLFYIPIFGWALWLAGMIPVDRTRRDRALRSIEAAAEKVRAGSSILIFAEGTRSDDGRLQPLKKGGFHLAVRAGVPIVPISVRGGRDVLAKGSLDIRPGVIDVVVSDPVPTTGERIESLEPLVRRVRAALESGLLSGAAPPPAPASR